MKESQLEKAVGRLLTFGSFELGVNALGEQHLCY